ncbi:MAG: nucleotidyltransferase domain-containing protein [Oligoflexales bacterium]
MHIYIFGSICRGEFDERSDIDLLAICSRFLTNLDPAKFSIYSYTKINELWEGGNPFAWHLATEARLVFSEDGIDYIASLGAPNKYRFGLQDCSNFRNLFIDAVNAITSGSKSFVFELSTIFLAIRNFATCYALAVLGKKEFSRFSALRLGPDSLVIDEAAFKVLERSRLLSTRASGIAISIAERAQVTTQLPLVSAWMDRLLVRIEGK